MFKNHKNIKNSITFVLKIIITFLILYLIFLKIDIKNFSTAFSQVNYIYIFLAFLIFLLQFSISTLKWKKLVDYFKIRLKYGFYLKYNLIGFFYAAIMPAGIIVGEVIKGYKIFRINQDRKIIMNSILMDKITGFLGLIFSVIFIYFVAPSFRKFSYYHNFILVAVVLLFSIFIFLIFSQKIFNYLLKIIKKIFPKLGIFSERIFRAINTYSKNPRLLIFAITIGVLVYLLNTASVYFIALAIGVNVSFVNLFMVNCLANFAIIVMPVTFMGFGIREGVFVYFLGLVGIIKEPALALSILVGFIYLLLSLVGGAIEATTVFSKSKINRGPV